MCYSASGILGRINGTVLELKSKIFHGETAGISSTPIASTNRNAVEPAESSVKSLGSAGFLFVEKGTKGRS